MSRAMIARCIACCTAALASAALARPTLGPERLLPGDGAVVRAAGNQLTPAVARGGNQMLAVWTDDSSASALAGIQSDYDVVAARLDASGALIDTIPFTISREYGYQRKPLVSWNGRHWLVVWENQSPTASYYETRILAVRVAPDGTVVDPQPLELFEQVADIATIASNGDEWCVVGQSYSAGSGGLYARRIRDDGSFPNPSPTLLVPPLSYLFFGLDLESAGGEYLLTYRDGNDNTVGRRFSQSLQAMGDVAMPKSRVITSNGSEYFVVFTDGPFNNLLKASTMSPAGVLANPAGVTLVDTTVFAPSEINAAWDTSGRWWVSYKHGGVGLAFQRLSASGSLLDPTPFNLDPAFREKMRTHRLEGLPDGGVVTVWEDTRASLFAPNDIYAESLSGPEPTSSGQPISWSKPMQVEPEIIPIPTGYLLTFASKRSDATHIVAQRTDRAGNPIDATPHTIAITDPAGGNPSVAWNGSLYLFVWNNNSIGVAAQRFSVDFQPIDAQPFHVMNGASPDVAALGQNFLVVTTNFLTNPHFRAAYFRRVSGDGELLDPGARSLNVGYALHARVEAFAGRWLVAWHSHWSHDNPQSDALRAFVSADGSFTPTQNMSAVFQTGGSPDIAAGPDSALLIWRANSLANANNDVYCRRMLPDGSYLDASNVLISNAPSRQLNPVAAWTGAEFVAAWDDFRDGETFFDVRSNIYTTRVSNTGAVLDPTGAPAFNTPTPEITPAIASGGNGAFLIAAPSFRADAATQAYRIAYRVPQCPGDVNGDNTVNFADLNIVLSSFGQSAPPGSMPGDLNGDGVVNFADLNIVLSNFGLTC